MAKIVDFDESMSGSDDEAHRYLTDRKFCPHCRDFVSLKTFACHKRLHFDQTHDQWFEASEHDEETMSSESAPSSPASITLASEEVSPSHSPPGSPSFSLLENTIVENESMSESDSPLDDVDYEIWNEAEDEVFADIDAQTEVPCMDVEGETGYPFFTLSRWLVHFVLVMQAVFRLSDAVVNHFLAFFKLFFSVLGRYSPAGSNIAKHLPSSLYTARKVYEEVAFRKYVVCRKCHRVYFFKRCIEGSASKRSKVCCYRQFPFHPRPSSRQPCGVLLLKTVEVASGKKLFYPFLTYCYMGLEVSIQSLVNRPTFLSNCEKWRQRRDTGVLRDVYDGNIWKEFMDYKGDPFLSEENNFALILNMDFFQPYKHVQYSLGAIYLTVMNLPRDIRYKQENTILVGLIPGPSEPKHDINSFLEPLVDELLSFWRGVELNVTGSGKKKFRCALLCVACDLPAGRKVCGFLGHMARLGCSRCLKEFPGCVGSMDYSGFDRENWHLRNGSRHTQLSLNLLTINTKTGLQKQESALGCRYSVITRLPYFDAPRMLIVDPMHNLFLGSAKHFLKLLISRSLISEHQFEVIQQRVDSFIVPSDLGRIPHKIRSGFSGFTADQWKNWVFYFSVISLRDILPSNELECWRHFVLACRILSSKTLSREQIKLGDLLLIQFCRRTEAIFGKDSVTPNMHMHCHLSSCVTDYGPLHGFWLYAFERYNGILGSMPNNNRAIEIQLMGRFLRDNQIFSSPFPDDFSSDFSSLFPKRKTAGSVSDTLSAESITITSSNFSTILPEYEMTFPKHYTRHVLTSNQKHSLVELYTELHTVSRSTLELSNVYLKYSSVVVNGKQVGSHDNRTKSSSVVMVTWNNELFGFSNATTCRAAQVEYICKHVVTMNGQSQTHTLASLSWFKIHPKNEEFGKPITVWYYDLFESEGIYSLIPIQFLQSRCVSTLDKLDGETVLFVCPCVDF